MELDVFDELECALDQGRIVKISSKSISERYADRMTPQRALAYSGWSSALFLLALVMAVAVARFSDTGDLRITKAFYEIDMLGKVLAIYRKDHGDLPSDVEGLDALVQRGYLDRLPSDPWGSAYIYHLAGNSKGYELYSPGFNRIDEHGSGDDVTDPSKRYECAKYGLDCPGDAVKRAAILLIPAAVILGVTGFFAFGGIALHGWLRRVPKAGFPSQK